MNSREKLLAIVVGALVALVALYFGGTTIAQIFNDKNAQIDKLRADVQRRSLVLAQGQRAAARYQQYEARALPGDAHQARAFYQAWLLHAATEKGGWKQAAVKPSATGTKGKTYGYFSYTLTGEANLKQLVEFLHRFYSLECLHRVQSLRVLPIKDSKDLRVTLVAEALSLPHAEVKQDYPTRPEWRLAEPSLEAQLEAILSRNLFGPPNHPPKLATSGSKQVYTRESLSLELQAADANPLDVVAFRLADGAPPGARLSSSPRPVDPKTNEPHKAKLSWTPSAPGKYSFTVEAVDDGLPALTARSTFEVVVADRPPPPKAVAKVEPPKKLDFDPAKHTYLTAIVAVADEPRVWLLDRVSNQRLERREGDKVAIGGFDAIVRTIGAQDVVFEANGKRYLVAIGENLGEATELPAAAPR